MTKEKPMHCNIISLAKKWGKILWERAENLCSQNALQKILKKSQNFDSYRLLRFGVGLFNDNFGVGYGVEGNNHKNFESDLKSGLAIHPESGSESRVAENKFG